MPNDNAVRDGEGWYPPMVHRLAPGAQVCSRGRVCHYVPISLNVLKEIYDHSCYRARSDEYQHLMTDLPTRRSGLGKTGRSAGGRMAPVAVGGKATFMRLCIFH